MHFVQHVAILQTWVMSWTKQCPTESCIETCFTAKVKYCVTVERNYLVHANNCWLCALPLQLLFAVLNQCLIAIGNLRIRKPCFSGFSGISNMHGIDVRCLNLLVHNLCTGLKACAEVQKCRNYNECNKTWSKACM